MSDHDLIDQLGRYGAWLEDREGVAMSPGSFVPGGVLVDETLVQADNSGRPVWLVAAAAVAAVVGLVGLGLLSNRDGVTTTTSLAADPPGALFVLPEPGSGFSLVNGSVTSIPADAAFSQMVVLGTTEGEELSELTTVMVGRQEPDTAPGAGVEVDTSKGEAVLVGSIDFWTRLVFDSDGWWVTVTTGPDRLEAAITALEATEVSVDGALNLDDSLTGLLVDRVVIDASESLISTYAEALPAISDSERLVVETASVSSPLAAVGALNGTVRRTTVKGLGAWLLQRDDADGEWNGLAWQASPNRIIAVSGHSPLGQVRRLAEALRTVGEDEWAAATGTTAPAND